MIGAGATIGAGIFMNPAESANFLQSSSQLLSVWALGGAIAFLGAFCFAELGALFPRCGGQYIYLEKAFRPWLDWVEPAGGVVCFPRLKVDVSALEFNQFLREKFNTSVVPGNFFGAPNHFRLGFGGPSDLLEKGLFSLREALAWLATTKAD